MIPVLLTKIETSDKLTLEGIYVKPPVSSKVAVIWVHGLGSNFAFGQNLIKELSASLIVKGIGYLKFNTRGRDIVTGFEKPFYGDAFEEFNDCVLDIQAMIRFAQAEGYKKIILAGHSTGANKILYFMFRKRDRRVKGLILLGPICDPIFGEKIFGKKILQKKITEAKESDPEELIYVDQGIWTARRFLSLFEKGGAEDIFPYYDQQKNWEALESIKAPIAVIFGSKDEFLDRPAKDVIEIFRNKAKNTKSFKSYVVKDAIHGFQKREKTLTRIITEWSLQFLDDQSALEVAK